MPQQIIVSRDQKPVIVYYCKANLKTNNPIRIIDPNYSPQMIIDCNDIRLQDAKCNMSLDNSTGKAKASGARCVLYVESGTIEVIA